MAKDIMTQAIYTVSPDMHLIDMDKALYEQKISGAPVVENGILVGIISRTDISHKLSDAVEIKPGQTTFYWEMDGSTTAITVNESCSENIVKKMQKSSVADVMTKQVISVESTDSVKTVAALMVEHKIHRVLIVDDNKLVGLVSSLDIAREFITH